ncbi:MAG: redoxin domain-containing protein [Pseudomonadota bacterium]|nr:redoxin domain-containing protein [Pseudomonadota bacterium]
MSEPAMGLIYRMLASAIVLVTLAMDVWAREDGDKRKAQEGPSAIEFDSDLPWLNVSRPLTLSDLKGRVVILDFWTYGCVNCIHVLADLRRLEHKFGDGLAVIGVHSPKFDNEKNLQTLRRIVVRYGIEHPVVNDVEFTLGKYYGMRAWPTQVVIDPQGGILGYVTGEGHYELLEETVEGLIETYEHEMNRAPLPLALESERVKETLLAAPGKVAASDRFVAISDTLHNRVIISDHDGNMVKVVGGPEAGYEDGDVETARFLSPQGLAFSSDGLLIADTGNHAIRRVHFPTWRVSTVAGRGEMEIPRFGEFDARSVGLRSPWGLALRGTELFIAMAGNHQIWRLDLATQRIVSYAGSGREGITDGVLARATFSQPSGLSLIGDWLYVADAEASAIRRIHLEKERVETVVGKGLFDFGDRDGDFDDVLLQHALGVAALSPEMIMIADTYNHKLKLLDLGKRKVTTLAGTGSPGRSQGKGSESRMNEPGGVVMLDGKILIADTNNDRIVQFDLRSRRLTEWKLKGIVPVGGDHVSRTEKR